MIAAMSVVLLLLTLYQGEALQCNYCFGKGSTLCNPSSVQECPRFMNACGAVILQGPLNSSFRQCMDMAICQSYVKTPGVIASCCSTDLCN